ncbi:hypothetical protein EVAR_959_1 [Eumeta japonica]|uniref:Uncharacterized protein n=1 Tax=Eumeta variegata TaxID=151549 RepID=A0A4C1SH03_EUMVA|nr:hypothetical protein EVAR_959_1 [Eumeta japonica]
MFSPIRVLATLLYARRLVYFVELEEQIPRLQKTSFRSKECVAYNAPGTEKATADRENGTGGSGQKERERLGTDYQR